MPLPGTSLVLFLSTCAGIAVAQNFSAPTAVCEYFAQTYPNITSYPNSTAYVSINEDYWSAAAWLGPACIVAPSSSEVMSAAVKALVQHNTPFAIRGGGHMAIAGYANIDSTGVLLSSSNLNQLELSEDQSSIAVGPGNRWGAVLNYTEEYGLAVVGGRLAVVGVPGLILGGGISNFGNEHGWASSNIDAYECVLADGTLVTANATNEYADLFWALRGGGNSFCIVTNFQMRTIEVPVMTAGQRSWGTGDDVANGFLDAIYYMAVDPSPDVKGAITPVARASDSINGTSYNAMLFYNGNNTTPPFFANFSSPVLAPDEDSFEVMPGMGSAATVMSKGIDMVLGMREAWWMLPMRANREALQIVHDTYFEMIQEYFADMSGWITGFAPIIISKEFVVAGIKNGGDPMGLDPTQAPYIWIEESITWSNEEDDATVQAFYKAFNANVTTQLEPLGVLHKYIYLNDANEAQDVYAGYPKSSVLILQTIRDKYDPDKVFTNLMPGGWKIADA
ncbi:hypothetical protein SLS53_009206 [Cytospora paraplurivora]|uniref:FAD-binding PCMH-type domain-containing protein n=1 Tax=Cytospora paraplurivora TaxID=2898453 RepID=A0AAN9U4C3_9PEZI